MIASAAIAPGLYYQQVTPQPQPQPLRSDIAAFVGRTRRGPIGVPVRVQGWREFVATFGDVIADSDTTYAVRGYFENGGDLAWFVRLPDVALVIGCVPWAGPLDASWGTAWDRFDIVASSPGPWSDGMTVELAWRAPAPPDPAMFDVLVHTQADGDEYLTSIPADELVDQVASQSAFIRIVPPPSALPPGPALAGPRLRDVEVSVVTHPVAGWPQWLWCQLMPRELTFGQPISTSERYHTAIEQLGDQPEVALLAFPDLYNDFDSTTWDGLPIAIYDRAIACADALRDRLVLVDLPPKSGPPTAAQLVAWVDGLGRTDGEHVWRAGAAYHPRIWVNDPLGGVAHPLRAIAPSGHVAGTISGMDRTLGAFITPANQPLIDVADIVEDRTTAEHAVLNEGGVNLIRCAPGRGFVVMGGRTIDLADGYKFVAHRRLVHRLVRAIRAAAEPLVFETNGPALWFRFARAVTIVLQAAWRLGALKGDSVDQAYRVQCDAVTNPQSEIDAGRCTCLIAFAPATPMEFILLRVALSRDGSLEVLS
ncbi:MAG TPA: phage tail sheath C-terminal domain-containing protein [Kofleriaceae bacterium]